MKKNTFKNLTKQKNSKKKDKNPSKPKRDKDKNTASKEDKKNDLSVAANHSNKKSNAVTQKSDFTIDTNKPKRKRGRPPKEDKAKKSKSVISPTLFSLPVSKPKYLVKLRIDSKTVIFVKDEKSLKKWKALYPNAEEIL